MKVAVLGSRSVALDILNKSKYEVGAEVVRRVEYKAGDVVSFEVVVKEDAEMLAEGFDECDPNREYLVLTHGDGQTSTFRNSLVDLFLMPGRGCK